MINKKHSQKETNSRILRLKKEKKRHFWEQIYHGEDDDEGQKVW